MNEIINQPCDDPLSELAEFLEQECFEEKRPDHADDRFVLLRISEEELSVLRAMSLCREDGAEERTLPVIKVVIEKERLPVFARKEMGQCCAAASGPCARRRRRNRIVHQIH